MRGKAISSREKKIILVVFKHFKNDNSSLNENAVITLTFTVSRIVRHELNRQAKFGLTGRIPGSGQAYDNTSFMP